MSELKNAIKALEQHVREMQEARATTPSTPTVSEEDKARALRHLNECQEKGWALFLREPIETIQKLLLPTPRGEG